MRKSRSVGVHPHGEHYCHPKWDGEDGTRLRDLQTFLQALDLLVPQCHLDELDPICGCLFLFLDSEWTTIVLDP